MLPITGGLQSKRKRTPIRWPRPIRPLPITDGKIRIGVMEYRSNGVEKRRMFLFDAVPIFQYSTTPTLQFFYRGV
jgi:hypothetical protein